MARVTFRFSTLEDHEAIANITPGLYKNFDAMHEIYPDLMADKTFYGVVGEVDGKIIAFGGCFIRLNGEKLYSFGGRVNESYRGDGVYGKLKKYLREELKAGPYPRLSQEMFMTHADNPALPQLLTGKTYQMIDKKCFIAMRRIGEELQCSLRKDKKMNIQVNNIGLEGLGRLFSQPGVSEKIFQNHAFVDISFIDSIMSELPLLEKFRPVVLLTSLDDATVVSIGAKHKTSDYIIHFHYDPTVISVETLSEHIAVHLQQYLLSEVKEQTGLVLAGPRSQFEEAISSLNLTGLENVSVFQDTTAYMFLRDI